MSSSPVPALLPGSHLTAASPLTSSAQNETASSFLDRNVEQNGDEKERSSNDAAVEPNNHAQDSPPPHASKRRQPRWRRYLSTTRWFLLDQWFLLALGLLILTASQVQVPARQQAQKELVVIYLCVSVVFLVTGLSLPTRVLMANYARWKIHLFVQGQSFLMTSATVYAVVSVCATRPDFMDPGLLVGMIFTGCVPTTISSNVVMTRQAHGNQALTVVQSTLGNFLGPFLTPLLIKMYLANGAWYTQVLSSTRSGGFGELYRKVFMQLGLSLFLPLVRAWLNSPLQSRSIEKNLFIASLRTLFCHQRLRMLGDGFAEISVGPADMAQVVGQIIQNAFPRPTKKIFIDWKLNKISSVCLLIIIWQTYDQAFESGAFRSLKDTNVIFIVLISVVYYVIWTAICISLSMLWLDKKDTIAVAYCVPAKTPAMGIPLSAVMFSGLPAILKSKIQIPMVIYQGFQIAAGSLMTIAFRRWLLSDEEREEREKIQEGDDNFGTG